MAANLYRACDQILFFRNVKDRDGEFIDPSAVATYTITSRHEVDGEYQELAAGNLNWVSEGRWEAVLDADVMDGVIIGMHYDVVVVLSDNEGNDVTKELEAVGAINR